MGRRQVLFLVEKQERIHYSLFSGDGIFPEPVGRIHQTTVFVIPGRQKIDVPQTCE
ncbi:MAG TPA: hypothetical protein VL202_03680 [Pararhizobium sp.]|nr:hypothetical protein [Pararhizobium sp.]